MAAHARLLWQVRGRQNEEKRNLRRQSGSPLFAGSRRHRRHQKPHGLESLNEPRARIAPISELVVVPPRPNHVSRCQENFLQNSFYLETRITVQRTRDTPPEIYDSAQGAWIKGGKLLPSLRIPFSNGAIGNGAVYYFASRPMTMYDILLVYNIDENKWSEINHIIPTNTYCTPYLFECDGNLQTVMHLLSGPPARIASCAIFHLDFHTKEWKMLIRMPHPVYMDVAYVGGCVASGKQLCVTGNAPNRDLIVAVYSQKNDAWFWLPPCPITSSADLIERHTTFTFCPAFTD